MVFRNAFVSLFFFSVSSIFHIFVFFLLIFILVQRRFVVYFSAHLILNITISHSVFTIHQAVLFSLVPSLEHILRVFYIITTHTHQYSCQYPHSPSTTTICVSTRFKRCVLLCYLHTTFAEKAKMSL